MKDSRVRSWTKSFVWRVMGIVILGVLGYLVTGSVAEASVIAFTFHFLRVILYYWHERLWQRVKWGRKKSSSLLPFYVWLILLVLCFIVLGIISWGIG